MRKTASQIADEVLWKCAQEPTTEMYPVSESQPWAGQNAPDPAPPKKRPTTRQNAPDPAPLTRKTWRHTPWYAPDAPPVERGAGPFLRASGKPLPGYAGRTPWKEHSHSQHRKDRAMRSGIRLEPRFHAPWGAFSSEVTNPDLLDE